MAIHHSATTIISIASPLPISPTTQIIKVQGWKQNLEYMFGSLINQLLQTLIPTTTYTIQIHHYNQNAMGIFYNNRQIKIQLSSI